MHLPEPIHAKCKCKWNWAPAPIELLRKHCKMQGMQNDNKSSSLECFANYLSIGKMINDFKVTCFKMLIQETIMCSGVKQSAFSSVADAGAFSKIQIAVSTWPSANDGSRPKGPLQNSYVSYIVLILPMPIPGPEDQYQVGRIPWTTELQQSCSWTGLTSMAYSVLGSPWRC